MPSFSSPRAAFLVLAAAVVATHLPLLRAGYVQDDHVAVESPASASRASAAAIVASSYWEGISGADRSLYRPVTVGSYALERALAGGARPHLSHAVNLVLHFLVCALLYALATRIGIDPRWSLLAALLFAVTPAKSEAVANVVGRAEILAALFTVAAVRLACGTGPSLDGTVPPPRRARAAAWGSAACVLLAAASKETGFLALPLVALVVLLRESPRGRSRWIDRGGALAPSLLAAVVVVVLRTSSLESFFPKPEVPEIDNPLVAEHGQADAATALALVPRYARILAAPLSLANDYSGPSIPPERSLAAPRPLAGVALLAALAALLAAGVWMRRLALALGAAMTLLPYLLVSNLLVPVGSIFAERFLYMPAAGAAILAGAALAARGRRAAGFAVLLTIVLGALMFARSLDWKDDRTIFTATLRNNPRSPRAAYWLAKLEAGSGEVPQALAHLETAKRLWPDYAPPHLETGLLLSSLGRGEEAEAAFREAARLAPSWAPPEIDLAVLLHRRGDLAGALPPARKGVLLDPGNAKAWAELGHVRFESGRFPEAALAYRRAVALGRSDLAGRLADAERR